MSAPQIRREDTLESQRLALEVSKFINRNDDDWHMRVALLSCALAESFGIHPAAKHREAVGIRVSDAFFALRYAGIFHKPHGGSDAK